MLRARYLALTMLAGSQTPRMFSCLQGDAQTSMRYWTVQPVGWLPPFLHVIKTETLVWMSKLNPIHPFIDMTSAIKAWNMCPVFNQEEKYGTDWMSWGNVWVEPLSVSLHTAQWPLVSPIFQPGRQVTMLAANVSAQHKYHDMSVSLAMYSCKTGNHGWSLCLGFLWQPWPVLTRGHGVSTLVSLSPRVAKTRYCSWELGSKRPGVFNDTFRHIQYVFGTQNEVFSTKTWFFPDQAFVSFST